MTTKARPRNPAIPGTPADRTGSAGILRRAVADIRRRWVGLQRDVLAVFDGIRIVEGNDAAELPRTIYALTPDEAAAVSYALQQALARWVADGREPAHMFWWAAYDAEAAQLGTAQTVANLTNLSAVYSASRTLEQAVFSEPYRARVAMAQIKSYDHWTGLSGTMKAELSQVIGRAVVDGKNPKAVRAEIMERLDVGKSRAMGYAQTDLTDTLRQARWAERDHAADELGIELGLLHTSALIPTTRPSHAARNGKVFTPSQVREWYSQDGNRYRCFLPGTRVAGRFVAGVQSHYKGPAVRLVTAGGHELAVTANHPVLTARGMVAAAEVRKGDHLVTYRRKFEGLAPGVAELDRELIGAPIEDVFGALVDAGHQVTARVSPVDLHGDAAFVNPQVQVVRADRELVFALDASGAQCLDQLALMHADTPAASGGSRHLLDNADLAHARHEVGRSDVGLPLVVAHPCHAGPLRIAAVSDIKAEPAHGAREVGPVDAHLLTDRQQRLPGDVHRVRLAGCGFGPLALPLASAEAAPVHRLHDRAIAEPNACPELLESGAGLETLDEVVGVSVAEYEGHVYDLQERSGLLIAECIVASNCHCAQTECLLDEDGKPILTDKLKQTMVQERAAWERKHGNG